MPENAAALLAVQRAFAAGLRGRGGEAEALAQLRGDAARNRALLEIYRGNAVGNATTALSLGFPVVRRVVGEEFFDALARAFWAVEPSRSGNLDEYGEGFPAFLAGFPHVASLPYLADVARLELLVRRAAVAADHRPADASLLAGLEPSGLGELGLRLQPGLGLLASPWPVAGIWRQHQPEYALELDIDLSRAEHALVRREGVKVRVHALHGAAFAFWQAATEGRTLAEMLAIAFARDEAFDAAATLQQGFEWELVEGFSRLS